MSEVKVKKMTYYHGFTLVETVVSIGILLMGVAASLTLVTSTIAFSKQTESLIVVVNLAREGIEVVRSIRDVAGFSALPPGNTSWIVDRESASLTTPATFSGGSDIHACTNCALYLNNNQYRTTAGTPTLFWRLVNINTLSATEKEIVSTMRWTEHGRVHTYALTTVLTDWK
ncbi:MAG: prepilin-type N-terminal cleavage/methylation domain-containing protein [Patescibacteria group bacterium]